MSAARVLVLALVLCAALARAEPIIDPPKGFWVTPSREQGHARLFGASSQDAAWHVTQWNSPQADLGPFRDGVAKGSNQTVKLLGDAVEISVHGTNLPCKAEFDSFLAPNTEHIYKGYPSAFKGSPPLSQMKALIHRITVRPEIVRILERNCSITQTVLITAVVFRNSKTNSTFFYQLRLHKAGFNPKPFWWARGETKPRFGFGDNLSSFGLADAPIGVNTTVEVDLLPRIKELLRSPEVDIDRNPENWVVSNAYHGNAIWGKVEVRSAWSGFKLEYH